MGYLPFLPNLITKAPKKKRNSLNIPLKNPEKNSKVLSMVI